MFSAGDAFIYNFNQTANVAQNVHFKFLLIKMWYQYIQGIRNLKKWYLLMMIRSILLQQKLIKFQRDLLVNVFYLWLTLISHSLNKDLTTGTTSFTIAFLSSRLSYQDFLRISEKCCHNFQTTMDLQVTLPLLSLKAK